MTLAVELRPVPDPLATCARFTGLPHLLWLDSSARGSLGRFSFLTADPVAVVQAPGTGDPLEAARTLLAPHRRAPLPGLPPFQGGIAGYFGYDWGAELERVRRAPGAGLDIPDVVLGLYDWVIAWDHLDGRAWIVSTGIRDAGSGMRDAWARDRVAFVRARLASHGRPSAPLPVRPSDVASNFTRREFEAAVARIREYIAAGDVYQVNLAQQFRGRYEGPPLELYRRVRARNPAPFGAYLELGTSDAAIASISPERFLRLEAETRLVEARPIKGTRPRGATPTADAALARELVASDKDRAENVMIVDLLRNDLGKVCRTGSVRVAGLFTLESHPTVHHLVSAVTGELGDGADAFALVRAAFPGGSVTGAPKVRAMEIIAELERAPRGVYCGAIGYVSVTGAMDLNIPIRTMVLQDGDVRFHAGAGIVWDSVAAAEYDETLFKARALIDALTSPRKTSRRLGPVRRPA
ncbi:MAG TPA: aminodeoxychorismate synthase component I [Gemmatimonadales bacterium]|nr:aminodeoxychorismate synthase component I [Gemmatimonadales bacterium]